MTDSEKIQDAYATCLHQMIDITVEVDDIKTAKDDYKGLAISNTDDSFDIIPMNQACDKYKRVRVVQRR